MKILQSGHEHILRNGKAKIEKIKIKEVSSHFNRGWFYLCIFPRISDSSSIYIYVSFFYFFKFSLEKQNHLNFKKIKPLVIGNVKVKSKKKIKTIVHNV